MSRAQTGRSLQEKQVRNLYWGIINANLCIYNGYFFIFAVELYSQLYKIRRFKIEILVNFAINVKTQTYLQQVLIQ